jgi:KaiC/GvpD/RAD55 family RecA-like ATPase
MTRELSPTAKRAIEMIDRDDPTAEDSTPPSGSIPLLASEVFLSEAFSRPRRTYHTGIPDLDALIGGGIKSRQLTTIAGPTGKGKTGLCGTVAAALAAQGEPVLWITTELGDDEQAARFASLCSRAKNRQGVPDDFLAQRIAPAEGASLLGKLPIYIVNLDDPDGDPFALIHGYVRSIAAATGKIPILFIDYMQVLAVEDSERRRMSVTQVATKLRRLARTLDCAVIAISSVSRAYYGPGARQKKKTGEPEDPRDWLAAAKESGDVEYASAVFCYLDTDDQVTMLGESAARLIVAKSRGGTLGFVGLRFHGPSGLFVPAPESVDAMKPQQRGGGSDDERVLDHIRRNPGQVFKTVRRSVQGVGVERVETAIERLLSDGHITYASEERVNARGQRRKVDVLIPAVKVTEDDLDS